MNEHVNRASKAQRLLEDPAFAESTEALERAIVAKLKETQLDGSEATERHVLELVRLLQTGARYSRLLWNQVDAGKLASHELERKSRKPWARGGI